MHLFADYITGLTDKSLPGFNMKPGPIEPA